MRLRCNSKLVLLVAEFVLVGCGGSGQHGNITITDRLSAVQVPPFQLTSTTATCNPGEFVVGGGFAIMTPAYQNPIGVTYPLDQYFVYESYPSSPTSWTASFLNRSGAGPGSVLGYAHAECASGLNNPANATANSGSIGATVSATCPAGSVSGGGFQVKGIRGGKDVVTIGQSSATSSGSGLDTWNVLTTFPQGSTIDTAQARILSYAVCTQALTTAIGTSVQVSAPRGPSNMATQGQGSVSCPSGQVMTSAGFSKGGFDFLVISSFFPSYPNWNLTLYSLASADQEGKPQNLGGTATLVPVCGQ